MVCLLVAKEDLPRGQGVSGRHDIEHASISDRLFRDCLHISELGYDTDRMYKYLGSQLYECFSYQRGPRPQGPGPRGQGHA